MSGRIGLALTALALAACASPTPARAPADPFLAAFEFVQMNGGEAEGFILIASQVSEGRIELYAPVTEEMDRYVYVWGERGPAVPIFFTGSGGARFAGIQAAGVSWGHSPAEADAWAWRKLEEDGE